MEIIKILFGLVLGILLANSMTHAEIQDEFNDSSVAVNVSLGGRHYNNDTFYIDIPAIAVYDNLSFDLMGFDINTSTGYSTNYYSMTDVNYDYALKFHPTKNTTLYGYSFRIQTFDFNSRFYINITEDNNGFPNGTVLNYSDIQIPATGEQTFNVTNLNVDLDNSKSYWIVINTILITGGSVRWFRSDPESFDNYILEIHQSAGSGWAYNSFTSPLNFDLNISDDWYVYNVSFDIGNDGIFDTNYINDEINDSSISLEVFNKTAIDEFIDNCEPDINDNCALPIFVSSLANNAILQLSNLRMSHEFYDITSCGQYSNITTLNFTFREENNFTALNATFKATFNTWTNNESIVRNFSFNLDANHNITLCIYPSWAEYNINLTVEYDSDGYSKRNYFMERDTIDNVSSNIILYLLTDSDSTQISFTVLDVYSTEQPDVIIKAQRYYPELNRYYVVTMSRSDFEGKGGTPLELYEWYRFLIERNGVTIRQFEPKYLTDTDLTLKFGPDQLVEYFVYVDNVAAACSLNNATGVLTCTVDDSSGELDHAMLRVRQKVASGWAEDCIVTIEESGTVVCNLGNVTGQIFEYSLIGKFGEDSTYSPLYSGYYDGSTGSWLNTTESQFLGLFISFILFLTMAFMGLWNPAVSLVMGTLAIVTTYMLGLLILDYASIVFLVCGMGFLVYRIRT